MRVIFAVFSVLQFVWAIVTRISVDGLLLLDRLPLDRKWVGLISDQIALRACEEQSLHNASYHLRSEVSDDVQLLIGP